MKVEIDADELCELRRKANMKMFNHNGIEYHADLLEECNKLKEERDWWRDIALSKAKNCDFVEKELCDLFELEQPDDSQGHKAVLEKWARRSGYEVPE